MKGVAYIDGASRGNPGPAGAGAYLKIGDKEHHLTKFLGHTTNNQAEYSGLLLALDGALKHGVTELEVFADSELLVRQINGEYRVKNEGLKPLFQEAKEQINKLQRFSIKHVRREFNQEADRLSNVAIDDRSSR